MTIKYSSLDWKLILAAVLLTLIGIVLIMSAQHNASTEYQQNYYQRQMIWFAIAFFIFAVIVHVPPKLFEIGRASCRERV